MARSPLVAIVALVFLSALSACGERPTGRAPDHSSCENGARRDCYSGPDGTLGRGTCAPGVQDCRQGEWSECNGQRPPAPDLSCDGEDQDCDGRDACICLEDEVRSCYSGDESTVDVGRCSAGLQACLPGGVWGACQGEQLPAESDPSCDGVDDDCDGTTDEDGSGPCGGPCHAMCNKYAFPFPGECSVVESRCCVAVGSATLNNQPAITPQSQLYDGPGAIFLWLNNGPLEVRDGLTGDLSSNLGLTGAATALSVGDAAWLSSGEPARIRRVDLYGKVVCDLALPSPPTKLDARLYEGDVWILSGSIVYLVRSIRLGDTESCALVDLAPGDPDSHGLRLPAAVDDIALDGAGYLWTGSKPTYRVDTRSLEIRAFDHRAPGRVVVSSSGDLWFAANPVHRARLEGDSLTEEVFDDVGASDLAIAVGSTVAEETVWFWGDRVYRFDIGVAGWSDFAPPPGFAAKAVQMVGRRGGGVWIIGSDQLWSLSPTKSDEWIKHVLPGASRLLASNLPSVLRYRLSGSWSEVVDLGTPDARVLALSWAQSSTAGAVRGYVSTANSIEDFVRVQHACGPLEAGAGLAACDLPAGRFAKVELLLTGNASTAEPLEVADITLEWRDR